MEHLIKEIDRITLNFRKTPNRNFQKEYLENKLEYLNEIENNFYDILRTAKTEINKQLFFNKLNILKEIIERKLLYISEMAQFDLEKAIKIIPEFTGDSRKLQNFLNLSEIYHDNLKEDSRPQLIKFILKARLSDKVQNKLSILTQPGTFMELKEILNNNYKTKKNTLTIQTQLGNIKQNNSEAERFIERIEDLINELNNVQIKELGESNKETICRINDYTRTALNTLKHGIDDKF